MLAPERILLVKLSSLGDVLHALPALSDAIRHDPAMAFTWVVEESFAPVASWHPAVTRVIPVALRRWKRTWWQGGTWREARQFLKELRREPFDRVLDAQGLLKSALISRLARGPSVGPCAASAREGWASWLYGDVISVPGDGHALPRWRQLFAQALDYPLPHTPPDYGLQAHAFPKSPFHPPYLVFITGTTWPSKHWYPDRWRELARRASQAMPVILPWGNPAEYQGCLNIAQGLGPQVMVAPKTSLAQLAGILAEAQAVVSVDTGPGHLAAALGRPAIVLYGPSDPRLVGTIGPRQHHLHAQNPCAACRKRLCPLAGESCFAGVEAHDVWQCLQPLLSP